MSDQAYVLIAAVFGLSWGLLLGDWAWRRWGPGTRVNVARMEPGTTIRIEGPDSLMVITKKEPKP